MFDNIASNAVILSTVLSSKISLSFRTQASAAPFEASIIFTIATINAYYYSVFGQISKGPCKKTHTEKD